MAGAYPANPNDGDLHTTDGGTVYEFKEDHKRWVLYKEAVSHNDLPGLNDGVDYEHITQTQKTALHDINPYDNADAINAMGDKADGNPLHHDRTTKYTNGEAVTAMGDKADGNPLHHDRTVKYLDSDVIAALTALGFTFADIGGEFKLTIKDKNSADTGIQYVDGTNWVRDIIGATWHVWDVEGDRKMDLTNLGLRLGGTGARVSVFDTSALAASLTKVPTNTVVKNYVDGQNHYTTSDMIAALTALGFTIEDIDGEFKITHKDKNSADTVTVFHDGTTYLWNNNSNTSWFAWNINNDRKADITILGLRLGGEGARISEFDNGALGAFITKAPTSGAVKTYVDNKDHHSKYTNGNAVDAVEAAGLIFADSKSIQIDAYPSVSGRGVGLIANIDTDEGSSGQCLYMKSDGDYGLCDADDPAKMPCSAIYISNGIVLLFGVFRRDNYNFSDGDGSVGDPVYVGNNGEPTTIRPTGTGDQIQRIGIALSLDYLLFMPSMDVGERA